MKNILINKQNGHQIRLTPRGGSAYFQGGYRDYGRYAWCIKYYGWESDAEIYAAIEWAFGEHVMNKLAAVSWGFECISELLGRPISSGLYGRSSGWLVINTELSKAELRKVDSYVRMIMRGLPKFLNNERKLNKD